MDLWIILLSILVATLGVYYYVIISSNAFKKAGIPYVPRVPTVVSVVQFLWRRMSPFEAVEKVYNHNTDAKYVGFYDLDTPVLFIRDPELIKSIAVKNFDHFPDHRDIGQELNDRLFSKMLFALRGDKWRDMRNLLSPAFTSSKMKMMFKLMSECAEDFAKYYEKQPEVADSTDTKDAFGRYTTDVIATCAFGIKVDSIRNRNNEFYTIGKDIFNFNIFNMLKIFFIKLFPNVAYKLGIRVFDERIGKFFMNVVESTIRMRDEQGIRRPDMIQLMLDTRGKKGENELTIEDMTSQAFVFFLGGFETVSTAMCAAAHELAVHPDIQSKLQAEIDETIRENNGELTYDALNKMEYLNAVVNETLRLWPANVFSDRLCAKPFELEPASPNHAPYVVKEGLVLWFPTMAIQRDKKYFDEPEKFSPDRFLGENKNEFNMTAYFPFGLGPRMCIGNRFALMEIKALLFHLLLRCNLKRCEKTVEPIVLSQTNVLAPKGGWWLKIEPRSSQTRGES